MSNVDSVYSSSSRITSLFSDLDTDSIVKSLCSGQQTKIDEQEQSKTLSEWKQDAWSGIADAVSEFSASYCSVLGSTSMLKSSTYKSYSVTTADTSGAVSLTASGSDVSSGSISVSVQQLAKNASVSSTAGISSGTELSSNNNTTLDKLSFSTALEFSSDSKISFSINGKAFSFSSDTSLQSMINTINADEDAGVTMKYSRLTDEFTIAADSGGADSAVTIQNISGNAFGEKGAFGIAGGSTASGTYGQKGQNAIVTINDGSSSEGVTLTQNSNAFTIDGISYNLNSETDGTAISFNISQDYSATTDAVSKMVDSLNTLLEKISSYTDAKDYSADYPPLTDAQKEDMTDDQIEKWETKAKSGILRHDSTLQSLVTQLKSAFFSKAGGTGENATSIGISTASYFSDNAGLFEVDTDALKTALATSPDKVISIFTGGNSSVSSDQQGVIYKLRNICNSFDNTADDTLDNFADKIDATDDKIDDLTDKLQDMADRYYDKFSNMETALSKLNSSANLLSSMFSS